MFRKYTTLIFAMKLGQTFAMSLAQFCLSVKKSDVMVLKQDIKKCIS